MATKLICDTCGAEINPKNSVTYVWAGTVKQVFPTGAKELCCSCSIKLNRWLDGLAKELEG